MFRRYSELHAGVRLILQKGVVEGVNIALHGCGCKPAMQLISAQKGLSMGFLFSMIPHRLGQTWLLM